MTPELLEQVGEALYGPRWQSELARHLDVSIRTMQRWAAGTVPAPPKLAAECRLLVDAKSAALAKIAPLLPRRMEQSDRTALIGAPYAAPAVKPGDWIEDEQLGLVEVGGHTAAPIPWPHRRKSGKPSLILCGDLVRAVRTESEIAIAHWWGAGLTTIWAWRKALGIGRVNDGTARLYRDYKPEKLTDDRAARGRSRAAKPDAISRMALSKRGKPAAEATRAALLAAAKRPKSADWRRQLGERNRARAAARRRRTGPKGIDWDRELAVATSAGETRQQTAERLSVSRTMVIIAAKRRGLAGPNTRKGIDWDTALADAVRDQTTVPALARALGVTYSVVRGAASSRGIALPRIRQPRGSAPTPTCQRVS